MNNNLILKGVEQYYSNKLELHGDTPQGVDWNSIESQYLRFKQLVKLFEHENDFSILDYGCGTGEFLNYLQSLKPNFSYYGFDISEAMISTAKDKFQNTKNKAIFENKLPDTKIDYVVASGLFNVRLALSSDKDWYEYIIATITEFNKISAKGFVFNALTTYSDKDFMKDYLYYSDPLTIFDYCKRNFSKNVALLHDYNLYEFTIIVRK